MAITFMFTVAMIYKPLAQSLSKGFFVDLTLSNPLSLRKKYIMEKIIFDFMVKMANFFTWRFIIEWQIIKYQKL